MVVVLAVQVLTHNLDVRLLAHLLGRLHSKTDVASGMKRNRGAITSKPLTKNGDSICDPPYPPNPYRLCAPIIIFRNRSHFSLVSTLHPAGIVPPLSKEVGLSEVTCWLLNLVRALSFTQGQHYPAAVRPPCLEMLSPHGFGDTIYLELFFPSLADAFVVSSSTNFS